MRITRIWLNLAALLATVLIAGPSQLGCKGGAEKITTEEAQGPSGQAKLMRGPPGGVMPSGIGPITPPKPSPLVTPPVTHILSINVSGGGNVTGEGINCPEDPITCVTKHEGETTEVNLNAAPADEFEEWESACTGGDSTCSGLIMSADKNVGANFAPPEGGGEQRKLTLSFKGLGAGVVSVRSADDPPSRLTCTTDCFQDFPMQRITLTATPIYGSFYQWGEGPCSGETETCELDIAEDTVVIANFRGPPPEVVSTVPAPGATEVAVRDDIQVRFSQPMKTISDRTFLLKKGDGVAVREGDITIGSFDDTEKTVTVTHRDDLSPMSIYEARLIGGPTGVKNIEETPLSSDYVWSFRTVDAKWLLPGFDLDQSYHKVLGKASVAADNAGYFAAIWKRYEKRYHGSDTYSIYVNRYKPGQNWRASPAPLMLDMGSVSRPLIAINPNGGYVSWIKEDGGNTNIYMAGYDIINNRTKAPPEPVLSSSIPSLLFKEYNMVAECHSDPSTSSNARVVWVKKDEEGNGVLHAVYVVVNVGDDLSTGPVVRLSSSSSDASDVHMAADCQGNVFITWVEDIADHKDVHVARCEKMGRCIESSENISTSGNATEPKIIVRGDGELAIVVWKEMAGGTYRVKAKRYISGTWERGLHQVGQTTEDIIYEPMVAMSSNGDAVVAYRQGNIEMKGLYAKLYNAETERWGGLVEIVPKTSRLGDPAVGMDDQSNTIIAWNQRVSEPSAGEFDVIYARRRLWCELNSCSGWDTPVEITRVNRAGWDLGLGLIYNPKLAVSGAQGSALLIWDQNEKVEVKYPRREIKDTTSIRGSQFDIGITPSLKRRVLDIPVVPRNITMPPPGP